MSERERALLRRTMLVLAAIPFAGCTMPAEFKFFEPVGKAAKATPTASAPAQTAAAVPNAAAPIAPDAASLTYRLDARRLNLPLTVMRIDHQQVVYDQMPSSPLSQSATGTLVVDYPHAEAPPGYARARVIIASGNKLVQVAAPAEPAFKPGWHYNGVPLGGNTPEPPKFVDRPEIQEVWLLDLPKAELDFALESLRRQNYFAPSTGVAGGAEISTRVAGREDKKPWAPVPELDMLMQRVRREGQLISYTRPAVAARPVPQASSVSAFQAPVPQQPGAGPMAPIGPGPSPNNVPPYNSYPAPGGISQQPAPPAAGAPPVETARWPSTYR